MSSELIDMGIVGAVVSSLAAAVVELYRRVKVYYQKIEKKLDLCEERHLEKDNQLNNLRVEFAKMKGEQEAIRNLAQQVLDSVSEKSVNEVVIKNNNEFSH
jgi:hypothetical protein